MARIAGINIPNDKKLFIALTYIYGIGPSISKLIIEQSKINGDLRVKDIPESDIEKLRRIISDKYKIEGDLRLQVSQDIKRLKEINSYRGQRHTKGLPLRGQRTRTNARTKRGKRSSAGSGRIAPSKRI